MKGKLKVIVVMAIVIVLCAGVWGCSTPATSAQEDGTAAADSATVEADTDTSGAVVDQGGAVAPKNGETYKVGFSSYILVYNSWITLEAKVKEFCEANGWEYFGTNAEGDINKQIADMEDLAAQNCDLIFINTTDPEIMVPTVNQIVEAGTPVIALDNYLSSDAEVLTTVCTNNYQNGYLVGEWAASKVDGPAKVVILSGVKGEKLCEDRREGCLAGFTESRLQTDGESNVEIVAQIYTDWFADTSIAGMEDVLARNVDFNLIISEADVMALPVYDLLQNKGLADQVIFASTADAQKEALELLVTGVDNYATGLNSFVQQAQMGVDAAKAYFEGEKIFPERTYTETVCITKDNAADYYDPDAIF